ncbi:hypothetical protein FB451DRAFT_1181401 [Mycena latifolia]|nr:hypothetical protein FB451DRAFT_1181401 [Mycena latifolia]
MLAIRLVWWKSSLSEAEADWHQTLPFSPFLPGFPWLMAGYYIAVGVCQLGMGSRWNGMDRLWISSVSGEKEVTASTGWTWGLELRLKTAVTIPRDKEASLFPGHGSEHSYVHGWMLLTGFNDPQLVKVPALSNGDELLLSPEYLLAGASSYPTASQRSIIFNFDDECKTTFTLLYLHYDPWFFSR